jgi:hypothetical protein
MLQSNWDNPIVIDADSMLENDSDIEVIEDLSCARVQMKQEPSDAIIALDTVSLKSCFSLMFLLTSDDRTMIRQTIFTICTFLFNTSRKAQFTCHCTTICETFRTDIQHVDVPKLHGHSKAQIFEKR